MKKLLLLSATFLITVAHAENWLNDSKIIAGSNEAYSLKIQCERVSGEKCYDLGTYPSSVYSRAMMEVDDISKPLYERENESSCTTDSNCKAKSAALICAVGFYKDYDLTANKVFCSKLVGYEKKLQETIALDSQKLQSYEAQETVKAAIRQKEANLQTAIRKIDCGTRVIALMVIRNVPKNLTPQQVAQMNTVYAPIKGLLETASLVTAKSYIEGTQADGILITEADKADLAAETQKCIDLQ